MADERLAPEEARLFYVWKYAYEAAMARIGRDISDDTSLSPSDYAVLSRLHDLGRGYMAQQDLADSMRWDKSRLSHHLTRMEARKLVRRKAGPGKGVTVLLTAEGKRQLQAAWPAHAQAIRKHLLWRLNASQRRALLEISKLLHDD